MITKFFHWLAMVLTLIVSVSVTPGSAEVIVSFVDGNNRWQNMPAAFVSWGGGQYGFLQRSGKEHVGRDFIGNVLDHLPA